MAHAPSLNDKYDSAAPGWGDETRLLGNYDAYLGLLSALSFMGSQEGRRHKSCPTALSVQSKVMGWSKHWPWPAPGVALSTEILLDLSLHPRKSFDRST